MKTLPFVNLETCLMLLFLNQAKATILLRSSIKPSPYKITERRFNLSMKFQPSVHLPITFNASDPEFTERKCLLNGMEFLTAFPSKNCDNIVDIPITCQYEGNFIYCCTSERGIKQKDLGRSFVTKLLYLSS